MGIKESLCPLCGEPSPGGEICGRCRAGQARITECPPRIAIVCCPTCGARKEAGIWTDIAGEFQETAVSLILQSARFHPDLKEPECEISFEEIGSSRSRANCLVKGTLYGVPVEERFTTEISLQKEQCGRCSRIRGSYYEGVVQVRASGRRPTTREIAESYRIARDVEETLTASGERLSFISQIDESRDGLDIIVGSQQLGQEISAAIIRALGGKFTTHPKIVGEKAGKQVFRITYSLRLPRFSRGDIILVSGRHGEVLSVDGKNVKYLDIETGSVRTVQERHVERRAGFAEEATQWLVAFRDGETLGLLEPGSGITRECRAPHGRDITAGSTVRVLKDDDRIIILR